VIALPHLLVDFRGTEKRARDNTHKHSSDVPYGLPASAWESRYVAYLEHATKGPTSDHAEIKYICPQIWSG